jgi:hypothetical protein
MKLILAIITLCLCQLSHAQKEDSLLNAIDQVEISSLTSREATKAYFKDVSDLFLGVQNQGTAIASEYGFKSTEHDSILLLEETINEFLLLKMREYLSIHSYPTEGIGDTMRVIQEDGTEVVYLAKDVIASLTAIKIFVNAADTPENIDLKKLYFPMFYQAYKHKDIGSSSLWNLLHGLYRQVKHEEYANFDLSEEEQIEILIDELQLRRRE